MLSVCCNIPRHQDASDVWCIRGHACISFMACWCRRHRMMEVIPAEYTHDAHGAHFMPGCSLCARVCVCVCVSKYYTKASGAKLNYDFNPLQSRQPYELDVHKIWPSLPRTCWVGVGPGLSVFTARLSEGERGWLSWLSVWTCLNGHGFWSWSWQCLTFELEKVSVFVCVLVHKVWRTGGGVAPTAPPRSSRSVPTRLSPLMTTVRLIFFIAKESQTIVSFHHSLFLWNLSQSTNTS